jgi:hypothetical protein
LGLFCLIGDKEDSFCSDLRHELRKHGCTVLLYDPFLNGGSKLQWRLDGGDSSSNLWLEDLTKVSESDIAGAVLRKRLIPPGSLAATENETYANSEQSLALLSWIWSLRCPVINRYPPEFWFEPTESLDFWFGRLERFGLEACEPSDLCNQPYFPQRRDQTAPQIRPYLGAVVGSRVTWDQDTPERLGSINSALIEFTRSLGLTWVEFRVVDSSGSMRIAGVEPFPKYDEFCLWSRQEIIAELVKFLTGSEAPTSTRTGSDSWF